MSKVISLSIIIATITGLTIHAAIPPISAEGREKQASDIVEAYVLNVDQEEEESAPNHSNMVYSAKMLVTSVKKGNFKTASTIECSFWKAHTRPSGWAGRTGQGSVMEPWTQIRAYMEVDDKGNCQMLEPNGFDVIENWFL